MKMAAIEKVKIESLCKIASLARVSSYATVVLSDSIWALDFCRVSTLRSERTDATAPHLKIEKVFLGSLIARCDGAQLSQQMAPSPALIRKLRFDSGE